MLVKRQFVKYERSAHKSMLHISAALGAPRLSPSVPSSVKPFTMVAMFHRTFLRLGVLRGQFRSGRLLDPCWRPAGCRAAAANTRSLPPSARIEVTVVRAVNGKPVEAAAVIFHPIEVTATRAYNASCLLFNS